MCHLSSQLSGHMKLLAVVIPLSCLAFSVLSGSVWAFTPDSDLLKVKGYSPEVITLSDHQRSRQEWREPSVVRQKPLERFFHNIYYGDWTGGFDEFGSQILRD